MKRLPCLLLLAGAALARADLGYTVQASPETGLLHVTLKIPGTTSGAKLQMPNWAPGAYVLTDNFNRVKNLKATDGEGRTLTINRTSEFWTKEYGDAPARGSQKNEIVTWEVEPAKTTVVEYDVDTGVTDGAMHWSGPSSYMYPVGRTQEKCTLSIKLPEGWNAYLGLLAKNGVYTAATYDVLADNPVTAGGDLLVDTYTVRGKPHTIVMRGAPKSGVDRAYLIKACKFVSESQGNFFGGLPYDCYVWHFSVNNAADGAGGLEHLSSTQIGLAKGVGPRAVSVLSHEFFHLWNVKRVRSKALGPFDYTKLPQTGALWWLEGVTDYYASRILFTDGWWAEDLFFKSIGSNVNTVRNTDSRTQVSIYDCSLRTDEANNGRGNSNGYRGSYYNRGWVAGMMLDIEVRAHTGGKKSLDDVERVLWQQCKDDQPGFPEDGIRQALVKVGGTDMGRVYDDIVMKPGDPDVERSLSQVGLMIGEVDEAFTDVGFAWSVSDGAAKVTSVSGPATGKLEVGDAITAINGTEVSGSVPQIGRILGGALNQAKVGETIKLSVKRGGETVAVDVVPANGTRKAKAITRDPKATPAQKSLGAAWLKQKKLG
ncbi:MAG: PDZ domain-containing protein [Fimbriimonadales bacterium]